MLHKNQKYPICKIQTSSYCLKLYWDSQYWLYFCNFHYGGPSVNYHGLRWVWRGSFDRSLIKNYCGQVERNDISSFGKPTLPLIQTKQAFSRFQWQNFAMLTGVKHVSHFFGNKNICKLFSQNFWRIDFQRRMWKLSDKLWSLRSSCRLRSGHKIRFWHSKNSQSFSSSDFV